MLVSRFYRHVVEARVRVVDRELELLSLSGDSCLAQIASRNLLCLIELCLLELLTLLVVVCGGTGSEALAHINSKILRIPCSLSPLYWVSL